MFPISEYFNRLNVFPATALSKDASQLAYQSSLTGSPQIWLGQVPSGEGLLSYPKPLTTGKDEQPHVMLPSALQWVGNDKLICLMDRHGDEQTFIRIHDFKTGTVADIPVEKGARDYLGFVSKDHKTYFFGSNRGNLSSQGLYTYDFKSGKVEKWFHDPAVSSSWSGNQMYRGRRMFAKMTSTLSNSLHLIDPKTKEVTDLFDEPGTILGPVEFLPDGKLLVISNSGRQFMGLATIDLKSKALNYIERDQWDVDGAEVSPDKKSMLVLRNIAGRSRLDMYTWPRLKKMALNMPSDGVIDGFAYAESGKFAVVNYSSPTQPRDFYRLNLKTRKAQQLTDNWTSKIPKKEFSMSKLVQYKSEGKKIYSWLFLPKGAKKNKKTPVIIWPHGGPQWQERAQFRPIFQYFVGRGFAVWAPNPTGSTGFGKDFVQAICGQWGTADLPDMKNGIQWLKDSGFIDPKRIAIMGGSYGGYMTLRSMTTFPATFKAGVDVFGVSNLITFVKSVPPDWAPYMDELVGNPITDKAKLEGQSPINALDKIDCPLMVIQGAKDPRVVQAESDQVVASLRKRGATVEYLVFEDEGHGFLKLENELAAYKAAAEFLEKYL